ncbi:hypothetical protein [Brevundimonas diminuta]|uniref:hypothetical protein n=1 Tax=Brevundimonas diminuta TaxID=293 RepID=UPI003D9A4332
MSRDVLTTSSSGCESGAGVRSPIGGVFVKLATMAALSGAETLAGTRHVLMVEQNLHDGGAFRACHRRVWFPAGR